MIPPLPPRFLTWRIEHKPHPQTGAPVPTKVPYNVAGRRCDAHDPTNHVDYATAAAAGNVAYAMRAEDGWFFLDLDKCGPDWTAEAVAIFTSFAGCWGEVSTSGTGLHIMGRCDPSRLEDRKHKWDGWLEFYTDRRFVAFGGGGWAPIGGTERPEMDWTDQLLRLVPQREHLGDLPDGRAEEYTGPEDDDELIRMMLASSGGAGAAFGMRATVKDLWEANADVLARIYPAFDGSDGFDRSSADAALMSHLAFWTGRDMPRMDRLFRRSGLMREKYERREDYRQSTVQGAARMCQKVYDRPTGGGAAPAGGGGGVHEAYLTIPEMIEHFEGCTYIRDTHRVLVPDGKMLKPEQFNAVYGGHIFQMMPDGTKPSTKAFEALTENRAHRFEQAICPVFRPDRPFAEIDRNGGINTYRPPNVDMTPGDVTPFLDHMRKLLPDDGDREILTCYLAALVQHPGVKFQWAPVIQGTEGNGKTLVFSAVAYAVGEEYTHMPQASQLAEKFNAYLEGKVFVLVEEVHMRGRMEILDTLKPLVTNTRIEIRGMAQEKRMIDNLANWGFCTNYQDAVITSKNDRRYAIFYTAQQEVEHIARDGMSGDYFPKLYGWLRTGGYGHVAVYLRDYPIPDHLNPAGKMHRAPQTTSTAAAISKTMSGVEHEISEAAEDNTPGFKGGWVSSWALDKLLKDRGYRITRNKQADILLGMGYQIVGRASSPVMVEDGKRPMLYAKPGVSGDVRDYAAAQHYAGF